ncbi:MAG TPA: FAD-binding oxidoreductase [Actinomycetota bacterium]|nr:FAD-binding oxidoreductase [Actinomycetota bacterium]
MTLTEQLAELLDPGAVSTDPDDLDAHAADWAPRALLDRRRGAAPAPPACVVRPRSTGEVAALLEWADRTGTAVVPWGGGSSVLGSAVPSGRVVVDLTALDAVDPVDERSRLVHCGAGVTGPALAAHLDAAGYLLGHEPQSVGISTVGGWIATRACGQLSARYGGIESLLAGFIAVLPGGRVVRSKTVPRRAAGPDVASLLIGSEGTLGIVTEADLRVSPVPRERADAAVRFEHMSDGVAACRTVVQSEVRPTLVRLYDAEDSAIFLRHFPDEAQGPLLLLSFDGEGAAARAGAAVELAGGSPAGKHLVEHWWSHRNDAVGEFRRLMAGEGILGPHALVETVEVAGTWTVLRDLYHSMKEALRPLADIAGCHVSHVYRDGACLYFTLAAACSDDDEAHELLGRWWETAMRTCLDAGGSISHHHGIGRVKAPWLEEELGGWFDVLRAVKSAIDPKRVMNPGALGL